MPQIPDGAFADGIRLLLQSPPENQTGRTDIELK
jgi:hypothetical protein